MPRDPVDPVEAATIQSAEKPATSGFGFRWVICGLLFFATTINYVDRVTMSVMESELRKVVDWSATQYGDINAYFLLAYALASLFAGWLIDKLGTRVGFALSLVVWSLMSASHALARNITEFKIARFGLGIGESGNFPAAIKTVAEWFPKSERALATGIFNTGANIGQVVAPLVVPPLVLAFGWKSAFIVTGLAGLIWVLFWWPLYRRPQEHPRISTAELAFIERDPPDTVSKVPFRTLLPFRQTWAFAAGKFLTDSIWWFFVFWFPKFMSEQFDADIKNIGGPMITVYLLATVGSITGGWQSSWLLGRGWSTNAARKTAMLTCALCVVPVAAAPLVAHKWIAVLLVGLATAAHQGFSCNLYTLVSDMFPRPAVATVVGIGTFAGALGGFFLQLSAGRIKDWTGNYIAIFAVAASAYLAALVVIHLLVPRLESVQLGEGHDSLRH
jgi:MFS transporter, ACS family, hexuronate transporter